METTDNSPILNNPKLHKLFQEYHEELNKIINGLIEKTISPKEIKQIFKKVDKKKGEIKSFNSRFSKSRLF